ncbi:EAL domain-containing protein [Photobacterium sp. SDRW27]|uniref:bifunctional diguanylate cyclase/phosphodiesterase n=1 Tax=Photobacterium obscurum TaxID=2829490 RepID=UPI002242EA7E|nr:EAL domain-containing protein [Photobacterium obscurum]MCW8329015.1 EAL domain-containing protein [Photobacterium obscurum]
MTLYRQLITWILAIIILFTLAVTAIHFSVLHSQIQQQRINNINRDLLNAELALQSQLSAVNSQALEQVIDQLFTNHSWQSLSLYLHQTDKTFKRERVAVDVATPEWFIKLGLFQQHTETRSINHGLEPLGRLTITTNTAQAYQQLWQAKLSVLNLSLVLLTLAGTIVLIALKRRLKPLDNLVQRAKGITNNQFGHPIPLPAAQDLRTIVRVINHLTSQLEVNFKAQAREAVKLREQAYRDSVSGLGNRSFFINQLNSWLSKSHKGGLALLKTTIIDDCYRYQGFDAGDQLVKHIATGLNEGIIYSDITLARLSYDEFALLAPNISAEKLRIVGETMLSVIDELATTSSSDDPQTAHVGLLMNNQSSTSSTLLSQLDNALTKAALTPQRPIALIEESSAHTALGKQQWKSLLLEAIDNDYFTYHYQPVVNDNNGIYQHEVFTAIKKRGEVYTASQFLGAIEDLGVGSLFDRHVVAQLINRLNADHQLGPLAINITNSSANDPAFIRWLSQAMERNQALSSRLFFELSESSFVRHPDSTGLLCSAIRFYKFRFGVDNYGRHFKSLDYLTEFRPDYVKIDFAYTHQLNDQTKSGVLSSISRTAHSLNIITIATRVETETQLERLSDLFVSGFQGFIIEHKNKTTHKKNNNEQGRNDKPIIAER